MKRGNAINISVGKREVIALFALLAFSFLVKVLLFPLPGYSIDTNDFASWFHTAATYGVRVFYPNAGFCDYPPFNIFIFWVFGSLAARLQLFGTGLLNYVIKLPPNIFDTATAFLIFMFVRKRLNFKTSLVAASVYAFNPAVIFNTAVWGQYDSIYTSLLVLSLLLIFASKPEFSAVTFTIGLLTKPQSIALAPLIAFVIFSKFGWRRLLVSIVAAASTLFIIILPFQWSNPIIFLKNIYFGAYQGYPYTTMNAFNIWAFGGFWVSDTRSFLLVNAFEIGWVLFGALAVFALYMVHRRLKVSGELLVLFAAFVLFFGFFMLPTRIHERYIFPALSVLALTIPFLKKMRPIYAVLTFTCLINQAYILYYILDANTFISNADPVAFAVSLINSAVFVYVLMLIWGEMKGTPWLSLSRTELSTKTQQGG